MSRIDCLDCVDGKENRCDGCNLYKISLNIDVALEALEELKWYREQDLIRRDDADNILYDEPIMGVDGTCYGLNEPSIDIIKERLANIPKAEPIDIV